MSNLKPWRRAAKDALLSGGIASVVSNIVLAVAGERETGTPFAPVNAISHWFYGDQAAEHDEPSLRHTLTGFAIHHAASTFWAVFYERWFGKAAERKETAPAVVGGLAVAGLACFVDYKMTPHRLQPGYEMRLSKPALFAVYTSLGLALALRGLCSDQSRATFDS